MGIAELLTFVVVATLLVMTPGPNGVLIAKTVPTSGRAAGFGNIAGFVLAFYLHGALAILGISILLVQSATAFAIVKYAGAAYLCWIGVKALWSAAQKPDAALARIAPARRARGLGKAFVEGFLTNALNPKVAMFYLAAFPQFITLGQTTPLAASLLVVLHSLINVVWFGAMVLLLDRLTALSRSDRAQRGLKAVTGVVFIGFGIKLATTQAMP
jgi:threonine/homoserine/homoserine lactone efflux protein